MKNYNLQKFQEDLHEINITLTSHQVDQFITYYEMLIAKNKVMNLTAITEFDEVLKKHFVDSLSLAKACNLKKDISLIDIGTGAGFPGIPLKIAFPELQVTLLDSLNKRVNFLQEVIEQIGLKNVEALHGRAEDFAKPNMVREKYDLCVSRAVSNLSTLSEYCLPYVKVGGSFISYKSGTIEEEVKQAKGAIKILGGKIQEVLKFSLEEAEAERSFIVIEKKDRISAKYPRKAGMPSKDPLK